MIKSLFPVFVYIWHKETFGRVAVIYLGTLRPQLNDFISAAEVKTKHEASLRRVVFELPSGTTWGRPDALRLLALVESCFYEPRASKHLGGNLLKRSECIHQFTDVRLLSTAASLNLKPSEGSVPQMLVKFGTHEVMSRPHRIIRNNSTAALFQGKGVHLLFHCFLSVLILWKRLSRLFLWAHILH